MDTVDAASAHRRAVWLARVLGGEVVDPWHVLADPEGNEFCVSPSG